jgi:hypothetical protein
MFQYVYQRAGRLWFDSRQGKVIFLYFTAPRPVLGPTKPPIQWVLGALSPGVKRQVREADHSHVHLVQMSRVMELIN